MTPTSCGGPITITGGGTYSGCYRSTSATTPAVTIATSAAVTLSHAHVIQVGDGVVDSAAGVNLTIRDTSFDQVDPGAPVEHRAVFLDRGPARYISEHNRFTDTDGQWLGGGSTISGFSVRDNLAFNIGRYPHPAGGNCCVQFLQLDHETVPSGVIQYNHVQNISGESGVDDNINLYFSGGSSSAAMLDISHNLIDGAYPRSPADHQYAGGGIMAIDGGTATSAGHVTVHHNTVVSTTNYGVACAGGQDCHISDNVTVNDRFGSDGRTLYDSDFGQANSMHDTTTSAVTSGRFNWTRNAFDLQQSCWMPTLCSGLVHVSTTEAQARAEWAATVPTAELPIGPRA
jgi:hypothetical protein